MLSGGDAPTYGKPNLGPTSTDRWGAIANRLLSTGNTPLQAAEIANLYTREAIGRRLQSVRRNQYIQRRR